MKIAMILSVVFAVFAHGVTVAGTGEDDTQNDELFFGALPATFSGTLPCADCPGIDYHLNLLPERAFFLRMNYRDRPGGPYDDMGRWLISSDEEHLMLQGGRDAPLWFSIESSEALRLLSSAGERIESSLNYSLRRQSAFSAFEPVMNLRGMYRYFADAGRFTECLTGLDMPVAAEAENRALEAAYSAASSNPGEASLVLVEGRVAQRMPMEGPGPVTMLVPLEFLGIWPGESCGPPLENERLADTRWRLTRLGDEAVFRSKTQQEQQLVFLQDNRIAGSDGCNRLAGNYSLAGSQLEIGPLAMTRMACPLGMQQAEVFRQALQAATDYRIIGRHLEMMGEDNDLLLRFEAASDP